MTAENIFSAVLTLSLMAGGVAAFGSDAASKHTAPARAEAAVVTLPTVTVVGRRAAPTTFAAADVVTLPTVTVVGRRAAPATVAAADVVTLPTVTVTGRRAPVRVALEAGTVEHRVQ